MFFEFPHIDPVAFSIGPLAVRWYALAYLAGFMLGWQYCLRLAGWDLDKRPGRDDIDDFLPWAMLGVILGGRFGYVLFYQLELYMYEPLSIFKIWQGGMSFHGGVIGVVAALIIYPWLKKFSPFRLADMVCAAVPIGLFFGRIANFINGELYGRITDSPVGMVFPGGGTMPRHPSQLYEAILEGAVLFLILFLVIRIDKFRHKPGFVSGLFLVGYGVFRSFVEIYREPDAHLGFIMAEISMGQILSVPMILAGIGLMVFAMRRPTP